MAHQLNLEHVVVIAAPPAVVFDLISDITRMGELSPECVSCTWTKGKPGSVGSRFVGRNRVGRRAWETECEVTVATPPCSFAWTVLTEAVSSETSVWRFDLALAGNGTHLVQTFKMHEPPTGLQRLLDARTAQARDEASREASRPRWPFRTKIRS